MSGPDPHHLRLMRAERRVELMTRLIEDRNLDLGISLEQTHSVRSHLAGLHHALPGALVEAGADGVITGTNTGVQDLLGYPPGALLGHWLRQIWPDADAFIDRCLRADTGQDLRDEAEWIAIDGRVVPVMISALVQRDARQRPASLALIALDLSERRRLEVELRHAQKMESLGQLSAGVAHEINTPMQYVGDNLGFIQDTIRQLRPLLDALPALQQQMSPEAAAQCQALCTTVDMDFVRDRLPRAIDSALGGVQRVRRIVDAMRAFSHPRSEPTSVDINQCLRDTLAVAHNEYRYVADLACDFGDLPDVVCCSSDLNHAFLNLIVNAAHAIAERQARGNATRGHIRVSTQLSNDHALIAIEDDGCGVPESIRHRIFDPFFTTKAIGKGTGQGLAIARSVVVDQHGGSLDFRSQTGIGTTFTIRLPIHGRRMTRPVEPEDDAT